VGVGFPDVYRGGLPNEVYISSWFPDWSYKVSFSADTGHTFQHVYICEGCNPNIGEHGRRFFMSDRDPGVFYIIRRWDVEDMNPWGHHTKFCIDYYRDYGTTLVDTYCHDITKNYEVETCKAVNDLISEKHSNNAVLLTWTKPESNLTVEGYRVFRNHHLLTKELITDTFYLDENIPAGEYNYYVIAYYTNGCTSGLSNAVSETIEIEEDCEAVTDLSAEKIGANSILIKWTEPNDVLQVEKYIVFRNDIPITEVSNTFYLDENLPNGNYEYYIITHYTNGCISDTSNCVKETIGVGIAEIDKMDGIVIYPNPTTGMINVQCLMINVQNIEIFDVFGRTVGAINPLQKLEGCPKDGVVINISHLSTGIYFLRITTENEIINRKIVKY